MRIATLIPAYKSRYIEKTLLSLSRQRYRNFDCYLSDDSPNGDVQHTAKYLKSCGIINFSLETFPGPKSGLAINNIQNLLNRVGVNYDLIHILFDDDLIMPDFYARHVSLHSRNDLELTASARYFINAEGRAFSKTSTPSKVAYATNDVMLITNRYVAATTIPIMNNWIGEYSNMVFRSSRHLNLGFGEENHVHYGLADLSAAIFVGKKIGYIKEHLGGFRVHPESMTAQLDDPSRKSGLLAWVSIAQSALSRDLVEGRAALDCIKSVQQCCDSTYSQDPMMSEFSNILTHMSRKNFLDFSEFDKKWLEFLLANFGEFWKSPIGTA